MRSIRHSSIIFVFVFCFLSTPAVASAQDDFEPFQWQPDWHTTNWFDGVLAGGLFAGGAGIQYGIGAPDTPRWTGPILADDAVRSGLMAQSEEGRERAGFASDVLLGSLVATPLLIEPSLALLGYENGRAMQDVALMNAQTLGITFFSTVALKHLVGRQRPPEGACYDDPNADPSCSERETLSFPSGHTSMAFAGAGLICLNHEKFKPLGGNLDRAACYTALGAAAATGALRIASNAHYLSDVVAGAAVGLGTGYLLPKWLYFGFGDGPSVLGGHEATLSPQVGEVNGFNFTFTW